MSDLKKGDLVTIKPEYCRREELDKIYECYDQPEKGRVGIRSKGWIHTNFPNTEVVPTYMLIKVNPMRTTDDYQCLTVDQAQHLTIEQLLDWLNWNDGHGIYSDIDCQAEDYPPITLETARMLVVKAITGE
jgi:hypothetical protein